MDLEQKNLRNLHALWQRYGAVPFSGRAGWWRHIQWPNRCWKQGDSDGVWTDSISDLPRECIVPVIANTDPAGDEPLLHVSGWQVAFEQVAMVKSIAAYRSAGLPELEIEGELQAVQAESQLQNWLAIQSAAFGYDIDAAAIHSLLSESDVRVWLYLEYDKSVAGVILLKTGDTVGVHQLAVRPEHQGQGIARRLMQRVLREAALLGGDYLVLQASAAGLPLYQSLGFEEQFTIRNYTCAG